MFTLHIDLGQVVLSIIAAAMAVMVYFVKRTVEGFGERITATIGFSLTSMVTCGKSWASWACRSSVATND